MPKAKFVNRDVKRERERARLSQSQAAKRMGVHKRTYQRWESAGAMPQTISRLWEHEVCE